MIRRRQALKMLGASAASVAIGTLPRAHADGSLDATVTVVEDSTDQTEQVGHIWVDLTNKRQASGAAIDPVVQCWAMERQTQLSWRVWPSEPVPPGTSRRLYLSAPGDRATSRLPPGNRALVRVWDRGTGASAHDTWEAGQP